MKKNLIIHFILVLLLKIGVTGCTEETISMNADRMPDIDGGLVGGASLKADFGKIVNYK